VLAIRYGQEHQERAKVSGIPSVKTKISARAIAARTGPFLMWDAGDGALKGFCARRQQSDVVTFSLVYRTRDGRQRWQKISRHGTVKPDEARKAAQDILKARDLGRDPAAELHDSRHGMMMDALIAEYVQATERTKKRSSLKSDASRIDNHVLPAFGKLRVNAVTAADVESFVAGCSPGSARRMLGLVGSIFSFAQKRKLRLDNPAHGLERPKERRKTRRLGNHEYRQLGTALGEAQSPTSAIFTALAISGWRSGEMRLLKHSEVDAERRIATLEDTKSGKSVRPISAALLDIIQRQERRGEFVFPRPNGQPYSNLSPFWAKLAIPADTSPHVLRHSLASLSADLGHSDHVTAGLLGHARTNVTSTYMHPVDQTMIDAADRCAAATLKLMGLIDAQP
jgi:integrase